jgi:hypothetical protein
MVDPTIVSIPYFFSCNGFVRNQTPNTHKAKKVISSLTTGLKKIHA